MAFVHEADNRENSLCLHRAAFNSCALRSARDACTVYITYGNLLEQVSFSRGTWNMIWVEEKVCNQN